MLTPEKQFLLDDPALFTLHYFDEEIQKLEDFHLRLIETATKEEKGLILYPAGHGKTTLVSTILPIWAVCRDPNVRVAIIAKNDKDAENIARAIHAQFADNQKLIEDFGPFRPENDPTKPWALKAISVAKRTLKAKEPNLAFFGAGAKNVLGHRTDWTICDDVVTGDNSATPLQREKMRTWFNQAVDTMARLPTSRVTVVGTRFHPEDLYGDLIELADPEHGLKIWKVQHEDAIVNAEEHKTLWPAFWPWKKLMQKKAGMGTLDFNKRYRNWAVDPSRMIFREEYITGGYVGNVKYPGCIDSKYRVGEKEDSWPVFCGFDPAIGTTRHAKFCCHITLALGSCSEHEQCIWIVDMLREQLTLPQQIDTILEQHQRYGALLSRVENNSYQQGLMDAVKAKMEEQGLAFRIEGHLTNSQAKHDPELGVARMSPWFENGQVHIPWGNPESMRKMAQIRDELVQYPDGRTTDTVMAFWFAWLAAQDGFNTYRSFNRLLDKPGGPSIVGRKISRRTVVNPVYLRN